MATKTGIIQTIITLIIKPEATQSGDIIIRDITLLVIIITVIPIIDVRPIVTITVIPVAITGITSTIKIVTTVITDINVNLITTTQLTENSCVFK